MLGLCTRLRDTAFKRSLRELPVGTEVDVEEPKGSYAYTKSVAIPPGEAEKTLARAEGEIAQAEPDDLRRQDREER